MAELTRNEQVVNAFRANGGVADPTRPERPLLVLTTTGRTSGKTYTTPLMYHDDGGRTVVFATHGGGPHDPDWFKNLMAAGKATVELPGETFSATPVVATGAERDRLYAAHAANFSQYFEYEQKTTRSIPVVVLERAS